MSYLIMWLLFWSPWFAKTQNLAWRAKPYSPRFGNHISRCRKIRCEIWRTQIELFQNVTPFWKSTVCDNSKPGLKSKAYIVHDLGTTFRAVAKYGVKLEGHRLSYLKMCLLFWILSCPRLGNSFFCCRKMRWLIGRTLIELSQNMTLSVCLSLRYFLAQTMVLEHRT